VFRLAGGTLVVVGLLVLSWSAWNLKRSLTPFPRPLPEGKLVTAGAYQFARHPIYLGVLIGSLGLALATTSPLRLAVTVVLFVFFDLKARREEEWLQQKYPQYAAYKSRVKKFIPWIY
jgi:protein-S-isoprenylcysteine O-methyltransferase Ste14